jgi:hypothetical protein
MTFTNWSSEKGVAGDGWGDMQIRGSVGKEKEIWNAWRRFHSKKSSAGFDEQDWRARV